MRAERMDFAVEDRAVGTASKARVACGAIRPPGWPEVFREERSSEPIVGRMTERTVQLTTLIRDQGFSDPEVDLLVELESPDRIE